MTVPEAVEIAKQHLVQVIPELSVNPLQLEELETPPHGSKWRFTFSTSVPTTNPNPTFVEMFRAHRVSKAVEIDSSDGSLLAVKNAAA